MALDFLVNFPVVFYYPGSIHSHLSQLSQQYHLDNSLLSQKKSKHWFLLKQLQSSQKDQFYQQLNPQAISPYKVPNRDPEPNSQAQRNLVQFFHNPSNLFNPK